MTTRTEEAGAETAPAVIDFEAGRRAFLRSVGLSAATAGMFGMVSGLPTSAKAQSMTDVAVLNFALNLEYLEAEFYVRAAFGRGLADADVTGAGTLGAVSGGRPVNFTNPTIRGYAEEIANDEEAHVRFLRGALGSAAVARPAINIDTAFTAAAQAAGLGAGFDAYANENNFLLAAFIFEDVGVTAYKGAARLIDDKDVLEAAAGLLAVEAYHAGEIRTILIGREVLELRTAANAISDLRDGADGAADKDQGIILNNRVNVVPTDANGLAFSRTPGEVLSVVYLGGRARGGFFPNGVNGALTTARGPGRQR